jgi:hypothetical protein
VVGLLFDTRLGAERMPPVGTDRPTPPLPPITQVDRSWRWSEHQGAWLELIRGELREQPAVKWSFGNRHVPGVRNEHGELCVRDRMLLDRKGFDMHVVHRTLVGIKLLRAHTEGPSGKLDQVRQCAHEDDATRSYSRAIQSRVRYNSPPDGMGAADQFRIMFDRTGVRIPTLPISVFTRCG